MAVNLGVDQIKSFTLKKNTIA